MIFVRRAMVVACVIFAGCMVGVLVQHFLPKGLADAKDAITTIQGLVTVLLALVLGLLIWTSYGIYSTQQSEVHTLGSQILQLGLALDSYGPEADRTVCDALLIVRNDKLCAEAESRRDA